MNWNHIYESNKYSQYHHQKWRIIEWNHLKVGFCDESHRKICEGIENELWSENENEPNLMRICRSIDWMESQSYCQSTSTPAGTLKRKFLLRNYLIECIQYSHIAIKCRCVTGQNKSYREAHAHFDQWNGNR